MAGPAVGAATPPRGTGMQVTVPAQHSVGPHQQPQTVQGRLRQLVQQRGQPGPIDRLEPDPLLAELAV